MTRSDYLSRFDGDTTAAIHYENAALSIGHEYLPACALLVLADGGDTPEYWQWLCDQVDEHETGDLREGDTEVQS